MFIVLDLATNLDMNPPRSPLWAAAMVSSSFISAYLLVAISFLPVSGVLSGNPTPTSFALSDAS